MNINKTARRGSWMIEGKYEVKLTKCDNKRSRVELRWYRAEKEINSRGRVVEIYRDMAETFIVNGRGRKAVENVANLIGQGCFHA